MRQRLERVQPACREVEAVEVELRRRRPLRERHRQCAEQCRLAAPAGAVDEQRALGLEVDASSGRCRCSPGSSRSPRTATALGSPPSGRGRDASGTIGSSGGSQGARGRSRPRRPAASTQASTSADSSVSTPGWGRSAAGAASNRSGRTVTDSVRRSAVATGPPTYAVCSSATSAWPVRSVRTTGSVAADSGGVGDADDVRCSPPRR